MNIIIDNIHPASINLYNYKYLLQSIHPASIHIIPNTMVIYIISKIMYNKIKN